VEDGLNITNPAVKGLVRRNQVWPWKLIINQEAREADFFTGIITNRPDYFNPKIIVNLPMYDLGTLHHIW